MRMAELVGASGRVIAVEPVPETFALLAANARLFAHPNVSLLNVAASDGTATVAMEIPPSAEGLNNYYQAHLVPGTTGLSVLTLQIDALELPRIKLVKIGAEGHELPVLRGKRRLLERDHPVLIVETGSAETTEFLSSFDYFSERPPGSSNLLCEHRESRH
jgi:FkbM family methyltransferase